MYIDTAIPLAPGRAGKALRGVVYCCQGYDAGGIVRLCVGVGL
jgi:hypothetical protein